MKKKILRQMKRHKYYLGIKIASSSFLKRANSATDLRLSGKKFHALAAM